MAIAGVVDRLFHQRHAYTHDDGAGDLVGGRLMVDNAAAVYYADDAADSQPCDAWVPLDLDELRAEGMGGVVASVAV